MPITEISYGQGYEGFLGKSKYLFNNSGKMLRPALVFLSAGVVNPTAFGNNTNNVRKKLIELAFVIELIHSASLLHDDVIDDDKMRRGQKTLKEAYGNKVAVLSGDVLYAEAFSSLARLFPRNFTQIMGTVTKSMSLIELQRVSLKKEGMTGQQYYRLIKNKTAILMGACCKLSATLIGAQEELVQRIESFGLSFGITYQLIDDFNDNDYMGYNKNPLTEAKDYGLNAIEILESFYASQWKNHLIELTKYIYYYGSPRVMKG